MNPEAGLVSAIFERHGISGPWNPLPATGVANRIYATRDVVLRVATDHPEAVVDARTESVAAPVARAAGILTPRLLAFDDTRTLVDRPFSLWERVHGETLGLIELNAHQLANAWRAVGRELSRLHHRVHECPDPQAYLDSPGREGNIDALLKSLVDAGRVSIPLAARIEDFFMEVSAFVTPNVEARFVHNDVHPMNIMCTPAGALLALIDWGDAGWGDPTLDFATIPLNVLPYALEGYECETPGALGDCPEKRFVYDKVIGAMEDAEDIPIEARHLDALRDFLQARIR